RSVDAGDLVFSYYGTKIQHLGVVRHPAVSAPTPTEFGEIGENWSNNGWYVPVEWRPVPRPFRPKDLIEALRPLLPSKYSPLQRESGDGLQGVYLASVPEPMAHVLLDEMGRWGRDVSDNAQAIGDDEEAVRAVDDAVENAIRNNTEIDDTERRAVISARRGQGRLRQNLETIERKCRVTGVTDQRLLRASHIKPWRSCANNRERLDGFNGLLLAPHVDHVFDRGYVSFTDDGDVMVSPRMEAAQLERLGISTNPPSDPSSEAT
ncbi:MAG: HNH endonuclease signature motif containing protein, partial [Vicinamibacterales bacterium]